MGIIILPIDEHRVPEGEETVFLFDRFFITMKGPFSAHEGRDEHDQRALWQMEVGDDPINGSILVSGIDENAGVFFRRDEFPVF